MALILCGELHREVSELRVGKVLPATDVTHTPIPGALARFIGLIALDRSLTVAAILGCDGEDAFVWD